MFVLFFFQAEDGIRDVAVTGVQTCALPILQPTSNHKNRKVTVISVVNYDKFQYVDPEQSHTDHISQQVLINNSNKQTNILDNNVNKSSKDKVINNGYKTIGDWGEYTILLKDKKKYLKHKWKDEPIKDYE
mgnify:CR=1 FL=1